jgi:hypothetical protein
VAGKKLPAKKLTLHQALLMTAALGGFLSCKGSDELCIKSLWIGLQRVASCVDGMRFQQRYG